MIEDQDMRDMIASARAIPMVEVLDLLDLERPNSSGHIHSIFGAENTPSLHVGSGQADDNLWYDFSTGKGGDTIAFVRAYFGCAFMKAVKFLVQHTDPDLERRTTERKRKEPERVPDLTDHYYSITGKATALQVTMVKDWMATRWPVDPDWAFNFYNLGVVEGRDEVLELWAPHYWQGRIGHVCGVKIRTLDGRKLAVPGSKFLRLYGTNPKGSPCAYLVEGESDTWSLADKLRLHDVYGLPSGAGMMKPDWVDVLSHYETVWLCLDSQKADGSPDEAGLNATSKWIQQLPKAAVCDVPGGRVSEALAKGWDP